jgi:hypothetical protein
MSGFKVITVKVCVKGKIPHCDGSKDEHNESDLKDRVDVIRNSIFAVRT